MGNLSNKELSRYSRHLVLPEIGKQGQERIKDGKILIVGIGGLGSPAALYLAAAGIGTLGLADFDRVEENNLQRQIIYRTKDAGKSKLDVAKKTIQELNPYINIRIHNGKLSSKNALSILKVYDVVIDGSDNLPTRYLVNDACVLLKKPFVYGSIFRFEGQASVFNFNGGPCYRCLFPTPPPPDAIPSCEEAGVLGVLPGIIGTIQATEALKILLGKGDVLSGRLLVHNALRMSFMEVKVKKNSDCPVCGNNPSIRELIDYERFCSQRKDVEDEVSPKQLKKMIEDKEDFLLVDVREKNEYERFNIGAKLVPLSQMRKGNVDGLSKIAKDKLIVVHCRTGNRSRIAVQLLKEKGFSKVTSLAGGLDLSL